MVTLKCNVFDETNLKYLVGGSQPSFPLFVDVCKLVEGKKLTVIALSEVTDCLSKAIRGGLHLNSVRELKL